MGLDLNKSAMLCASGGNMLQKGCHAEFQKRPCLCFNTSWEARRLSSAQTVTEGNVSSIRMNAAWLLSPSIQKTLCSDMIITYAAVSLSPLIYGLVIIADTLRPRVEQNG